MNSNLKTGGVAHADLTRGLYRVAIVGAASLKGKEIAEMLDARNFPSAEIKLLDDDDSLGQLGALKDEVTFIQSVRDEQFEQVDFTFFASDAVSTLKNWKHVQNAGGTIIDLSYALEDEPAATVRSPWLERQLGTAFTLELQPGPAVVAHPISVVLGLLMMRIQSAVPIARAVCTVFQPASEQGQKGMDELHQQTVNLLSFQPLPKTVFDQQVAFNMVARYGPESQTSLAAMQDRVIKHFRKIVGAHAPVPSVLMVQAPVFHSHVFSLNIQFEGAADVAQVSAALAGEHVSIVGSTEDAPSNVSAAGQGDILVSVTPDATDAKNLWLWAASDNLRVAAFTAVECAETLTASRPRGKIQ